ncbi:indolepyruvate ferredoxin oxidoreductase beta subunit [Eubacterium pyruvativorans]|uniref:Indolepyruvate ferredoxin oxidoreductase beta subunit n=1 Tax=Eubacterium pyruvativorans TaxID=155865 RepID=A0A1I7HGX2_9FIRM|nr:indolepyruvate oxidoreductase subunit beta [Eubacterium pyruvativorans]SDF61252.1 indolepyruvate ferredoxin oxidoreductase beta subunit [Eubacterium pyruvativorans]SFO26897.1 indolepyruvate ferredoxin oxidoreductase beta subunit [Eubacterium pyruvativorans]SFU59975.1 indolepyruvate ferredoxin oxidoreductase beta subunit [Eubacterium pyruvativorans]
MSDTKNVILAGVGGQGTILISKIMTNGLIRAGYDVKQSEIHGMAQRGGSVSTQVRWGSRVYGPVFGEGEADILIALERMEAVRYAPFLKPTGIAVINDYAMDTLTTASGLEEYPAGCVEAMQKEFATIVLNAEEIAAELGNPKCMNVVQFGACCDVLGTPEIDWEEVVAETVPEKFRELNRKAFRAGRAAAKEKAQA